MEKLINNISSFLKTDSIFTILRVYMSDRSERVSARERIEKNNILL